MCYGNFSYQLPTDLSCELRKNWLSFLDEDLWTLRIPNHETDVKFDTVYVLVWKKVPKCYQKYRLLLNMYQQLILPITVR